MDTIGDYINAINQGFDKFEEIEKEIHELCKINTKYETVSFTDGILTIEADSHNNQLEATITIFYDEIVKKIFAENLDAKSAICKLITEKICYSTNVISKN